MKLKLLLIMMLCTANGYAQNLNWNPQGVATEFSRIRVLNYFGLPIKDTTGGVGFNNRDSVGSLLFYPGINTVYVKGSFGYFGLARKTGESGYIQNQSSTYQSANLKIAGTAEVYNPSGINGSLKVNNLVSEIGVYNTSTPLFRIQTYWDGISTGGIKVLDFLGKGMVYESNYSALGALDDRWIPDYGTVKNYVSSVLTGGTVTSVGLSLPSSLFSVSGTPVTTNGTLSGSFINQTSNTIFAAPDGTNGIPSFRALSSTDIPSLDGSKITTGTISMNRIVTSGTPSNATLIRGDGIASAALIGPFSASGRLLAQVTTEQLRLAYDASNYMTSTVASNGSTTFDLAGTSPAFSFGKTVNFSSGLAANNVGFNLSVVSVSSATAVTTATYLFGGASSISYRVGIRGSTTNTLAANVSGGSFVVGKNDFTTASSGTHAVISNAVILAPTITSGGASSITNASSLYIDDAPTGASNNYALLVNGAGTSKFSTSISAIGGIWTGSSANGSTNYSASNLGAVGGITGANSSTTGILFGGAAQVTGRVFMNGNSTTILGIGNSASNLIVGGNNLTTAASGTHSVISNAAFLIPSITSGGATVTNATTVYIEGAPTIGTNNSALLVNSGDTRLQNIYATTPTYTSGGYQQIVKNNTSGRFEVINSSSNVVDITGTSQAAIANVEYFANNASLVTITLPTTSSQGDKIYVRGKGAGGWRISQNAGQTIHGNSNTTTGTSGYIASQSRYDVVVLEALDNTGNEWLIISNRGTLTFN